MDKEEFYRYINMNKNICVDRREMEEYPGFIRNLVVFEKQILAVEFTDKSAIEMNEGEVIFYLEYESYDKMIEEIEKFINIEFSNWINYTKTGWYPDWGEVDIVESSRKFMIDFSNDKISIPKGYNQLRYNSLYWEALAKKIIKVDDPIEKFIEWASKYFDEKDKDD